MIILYDKKFNRLESLAVINSKTGLEQMSWISLFNPSLEERSIIEEAFKIKLPHEDLQKSKFFHNKLYEENDVLFMNSHLYFTDDNIIKITENEVRLIPVKFTLIILENTLISIFDKKIDLISEISNFNYHQYLNIEKPFLKALLVLFENLVSFSAGYLEENNFILDTENEKISNRSKKNNFLYREIVRKLTLVEDYISRTRENLLAFSRILDFLIHVEIFNKDKNFSSHARIFFEEISILSEHTNFLSSKANFLLSIVMGLVNIEQNNIIKVLSLVTMVLTPPTLIASIYGMNFEFMPELKWPLGYGYALIIMLISSWLPYKYFKNKKWF